MNREQAQNYPKSSGMSEEQIAEIESAFTCEDAISRDAAIRIAEQGQVQGFEWQFKKLVVLPSVKTEKTGRWIKRYSSTLNKVIYECSECGKQVMTLNIDAYDYCHGCGCRMGGGRNTRKKVR